jgi:ATP synthase protein I
MTGAEQTPGPAETPEEHFERAVAKREQSRLRALRQGHHPVWFGLGMFGLVGWSVVLPTLAGIFVGTWIDRRWPGQVSWKLTLLFLGIVIGCLNAWYWLQRESRPPAGQGRERPRQPGGPVYDEDLPQRWQENETKEKP